MGRVLHGKIGLLAQAPYDLPPVGNRAAIADQVEIAAARRPPGVGAVEIIVQRFAVAVLPHAGLAQIIPGGPAEVADQLRQLVTELPVFI